MYNNQGEREGDKGYYCSSLGFMDLLGMQLQQASYSSLFDDDIHTPLTKMEEESSLIEVMSHHHLHLPTTPTNSSSISSANSCDFVFNNHDHVKIADEKEEEQQQQKTKKVLKGKKTTQKRQREQRFAFMTKSEVDHLEDGYRWRKYGQKAVKNSPFPRSYYRCTTMSCNVKKRVERSFNDPSIVVTTYEGQHSHHSPVITRPHHVGATLPSSGLAGLLSNYHQQQHDHQQQQQQRPSVSYSALGGRFVYEDQGLLQDIVSSHMLKEE